jgi:hypothetical protein
MYERNEFLKVLIKLKSPFQGLLVAGIVPMGYRDRTSKVACMSVTSFEGSYKIKIPGKFQGLLVAGIVPMAIGIEPMTTVAGMSIMSY